jgi:hypothetical protein
MRPWKEKELFRCCAASVCIMLCREWEQYQDQTIYDIVYSDSGWAGDEHPAINNSSLCVHEFLRKGANQDHEPPP